MTDRFPRAAALAALLAAGAAGIVAGRTLLAPSASAPAAEEPAGHGAEGVVALTPARIAAAGIRTERVRTGALDAEILAQASVTADPQGEAALTARADGAIVRIAKRLGDPVRAGEAIAWIESRDAAAIAAERSVAAARATAARQAYARERRLFDADVTARQDLEGAQAALAAADAELRRATAAAAAAGVTGDGRHLAVVSLIAGRISRADAKLGAYVTAGTELFRVADPARIQIEAAVTPADARRIAAGDEAAVDLADGIAATARVRSVTPGLDAESHAATVLLLPVGTAALAPGQAVRVRIRPHGASATAAIVVPEEAIQSIDGRDALFVRTPDGFRAVPVTVAARGGGRAEIVGIRPGTAIATRGAFLLKSELGKEEAEH